MGQSVTRFARLTAATTVLAGLSGPVLAQGLVKADRLSAALASEAVATAVDACAQQHQAVTAVVIDTSGELQAMLRGDGAGIHTVQTANDKAYTSVTFKVDTIDLVERSKHEPVSTAFTKHPHLLLAQGGVILKAGDEVIGAIGVSGGVGHDYDTQCARAALDKIRDRMK
jgi:uncharacterized protein GlcG (DUF336 family)